MSFIIYTTSDDPSKQIQTNEDFNTVGDFKKYIINTYQVNDAIILSGGKCRSRVDDNLPIKQRAFNIFGFPSIYHAQLIR